MRRLLTIIPPLPSLQELTKSIPESRARGKTKTKQPVKGPEPEGPSGPGLPPPGGPEPPARPRPKPRGQTSSFKTTSFIYFSFAFTLCSHNQHSYRNLSVQSRCQAVQRAGPGLSTAAREARGRPERRRGRPGEAWAARPRAASPSSGGSHHSRCAWTSENPNFASRPAAPPGLVRFRPNL